MNHGKHSLLYRWALYCFAYVLSLPLVASAFTNCTYNWSIVGYPSGCVSANSIQLGPVNGYIQITPSIHGISGSGNGNYTGSFKMDQQPGGSCGPAVYNSTTLRTWTADNQVINIVFTWNGGANQGPPPVVTNHWARACYKNNSSFAVRYNVFSGSSQVGEMDIPPGQEKCVTFGPFSSQVGLYAELADGAGNPLAWPTGTEPGIEWQPVPAGTSPTFSGVPPIAGGLPPAVSGTNPPTIDFTGTTGDAKDSTLKEGFSAMREALVNGFAITHQGLQDNVVAVNGVATAVATGNAKLTTIDTSLNTVKSDTTAIRSSAISIATSVGSADTKLTGIGTSLTSINTGVGTLNTTATATKTSVDSVKTSTDGVKTSVDGLASSLTTANTKLESIRLGGDDREALLTTMEYNQRVTDGKIATIRDQSLKLTDMDINLMYSRIALDNIKAGVDGENTKLTSIDARLVTANTTLGNLYSQAQSSEAARDSDANALASGIGSGFGTSTNILETLRGMSNGAAGVKETLQGMTNTMVKQTPLADLDSQGALAQAASAGQKAQWQNLASGSVFPSTPSGSAEGFTVNIPRRGRASLAMNLDPAANPRTAALCEAVRNLLVWAFSFFYFCLVVKETANAYYSGCATHQIQPPTINIFGNSFGTLAALPMAAFITIALGAIPAVGLTVLSLNQSAVFGFNPLTAFEALPKTIYLANLFIPVPHILGLITSYFIFRFTILWTWTVATTIVRFCVG